MSLSTVLLRLAHSLLSHILIVHHCTSYYSYIRNPELFQNAAFISDIHASYSYIFQNSPFPHEISPECIQVPTYSSSKQLMVHP